ncbi:LysR family transcriptional regulator (chromosome initiation inhibitor) [Rhodococcus sp. 27YEA15]|uniref:LysR family transcriptional regulator ArgP n=1 Tax=Rhodococcus sp. 27YEA15 TaxID=3156259 RepID=UPI003C7DD25C
MWDFEQLAALKATVEEGTFDAAAQKLHVTPSAISQRIKALETSVGRVLVQRTKPVRVTDSGREVLRLARQIASLTHGTMRELGLGDLAGRFARVSIAVNADSLSTWVLGALAEFTDEVMFDFHLDDQDYTTDLLRDGSVVAAITSTATAIQGCTIRPVGVMRYRPVATPTFCRRWFADGVRPESLSAAPMVVFNRKDLLQDRYLNHVSESSRDTPRHFVPSSADFADAVLAGYGWGLLPDLQTVEARKSGALVVIDSNYVDDVPLYWQQWKLSSPMSARIAEAVAARARDVLHQPTR